MTDREPRGDKQETRRSPLSESFLLALGPVAGYLVAYVYEAGFTSVYRFPLSFVSLTIESILLAAAGLIVAGSMLFMTSNVLVMSAARRGELGAVARALYFVVAPVGVPLVVIVILYGPHWHEWLLPVGIFLALGISYFGYPLLHGEGPYAERLAWHARSDAELPDVSILTAKWLGWPAALALCYLPILLLTTWHVARAQALNEVEYLVATEFAERVVLRQYDERLVLAEFDESSKTLTNRFTVIDISALGSVRFETRRVGPLRALRVVSEPPGLHGDSTAVELHETQESARRDSSGLIGDSARADSIGR